MYTENTHPHAYTHARTLSTRSNIAWNEPLIFVQTTNHYNISIHIIKINSEKISPTDTTTTEWVKERKCVRGTVYANRKWFTTSNHTLVQSEFRYGLKLYV